MKDDTRLLEIAVAFLGTMWGIWLLLPLSIFASSDAFTAMRIMPEWVWGILMLSISLSTLYTSWNRKSPYIRARLLQLLAAIG